MWEGTECNSGEEAHRKAMSWGRLVGPLPREARVESEPEELWVAGCLHL